jgi:hypothetical protein
MVTNKSRKTEDQPRMNADLRRQIGLWLEFFLKCGPRSVVNALSDPVGGASHSALQLYRLSMPLNVAAGTFG